MVSTLNFYLDDSGPRHPDHKIGRAARHEYDWFALGGFLIKDEDEPTARAMHAAFTQKWGINDPLHSSEIRARNDNFLWLQELKVTDPKRCDEFHEDLYGVMRDSPILGLACVIDRPGYDQRYRERYAGQRWMLCKTAFSVAVERAAKHARASGRKLRVYPEWCNKGENRMVQGYYDELKAKGMPFAAATSEKYGPLSPAEFCDTLYEFAFKRKTSPMAQMADLYLWPMCMGGYHKSNWTYRRLMEDGKLIEAIVPEADWPVAGTKYSCFDNVEPKP